MTAILTDEVQHDSRRNKTTLNTEKWQKAIYDLKKFMIDRITFLSDEWGNESNSQKCYVTIDINVNTIYTLIGIPVVCGEKVNLPNTDGRRILTSDGKVFIPSTPVKHNMTLIYEKAE